MRSHDLNRLLDEPGPDLSRLFAQVSDGAAVGINGFGLQALELEVLEMGFRQAAIGGSLCTLNSTPRTSTRPLQEISNVLYF